MVTLYSSKQHVGTGIKRSSSVVSEGPGNRPEKRARVLLSEDSDGESETSADENQTASARDSRNYVLSVNEDFARRFEHNKKREELQQRTSNTVSYFG